METNDMMAKADEFKILSTRLSAIMEIGLQAQGRKELIKHLNDERITVRQAVLAKCYDCMGYYSDGKIDCKLPECPNYMYMPYRENPDPRRKNKRLSDEQRKAAGERLKKARSMP